MRGRKGLQTLAAISDVVIIVDVLSFYGRRYRYRAGRRHFAVSG